MSLISYMEMSSFKIFMVDVGLLAAKVLLEGNQIFEEFKGALTEQFVAQELSAYGLSLYYYSITNSKWKIDFVIQKEQYCIPIEVKAEENLRAKSLKVFCEKYHPEIALRTSMSDYRKEDTFINVPLYSLSQYISNIQ